MEGTACFQPEDLGDTSVECFQSVDEAVCGGECGEDPEEGNVLMFVHGLEVSVFHGEEH